VERPKSGGLGSNTGRMVRKNGKTRSIKVGEVNKLATDWKMLSPINPSSTTTSFPKDDNQGRDSAMLDDMRKAKPHGEGSGHWRMTPQKIRKAITLESDLSFGRVYSHWKSLEEKKETVLLFKGFRKLWNRGKIYTPSLKNLLRGRVFYI
jgi:hypothetical protein